LPRRAFATPSPATVLPGAPHLQRLYQYFPPHGLPSLGRPRVQHAARQQMGTGARLVCSHRTDGRARGLREFFKQQQQADVTQEAPWKLAGETSALTSCNSFSLGQPAPRARRGGGGGAPPAHARQTRHSFLGPGKPRPTHAQCRQPGPARAPTWLHNHRACRRRPEHPAARGRGRLARAGRQPRRPRRRPGPTRGQPGCPQAPSPPRTATTPTSSTFRRCCKASWRPGPRWSARRKVGH